MAGTRKAIAKLKQTEFRLRDAARRVVDQADESLRVERQKFAEGRGTSNDLLLADGVLLRARTELATALADSQIALAALRLSAGEEPVSVTSVSSRSPTKDGCRG